MPRTSACGWQSKHSANDIEHITPPEWVAFFCREVKEFRVDRLDREFKEGLRAFRWELREIKEFKEFREGLRALRTHSAP